MKACKVCLATQNTGKIAEFQLFLSRLAPSNPPFSLDALPTAIASPEETGTTFEENARQKALYYSRFCPTESLVVAEDSGLCVDSLGGAPGVFSSRFAGESARDEDNIAKLLRELGGVENRTARFVTVIALVEEGRVIQTFSGSVEGLIALKPAGQNGFGYDPVFYYPPFKRCFAELSPVAKNEISHRARAMTALGRYLLKT
jgi:XTP/dITP diphosphohydrolase